MSQEVIVSGNTAYRAPPSEVVNLEPAPASEQPKDVENIVMRRIEGEPIHLDETGSELRSEIRKQREGIEDSITEWRAGDLDPAGEHESHDKQLRRASESLYRARMAATAKQFEEFPGVTEERARVAAEAVATMPPVEVTPVGDDGRPIQRLRGDQPVREEDSFRNLAEAKRGMSQYRDWVEREQAALLHELQAEENRQQVAAQEVSDQRAAEVRSYIQPQPEPQQPDPVAEERAALQAERQATAQLRQMSEAERKLVENVNAWDRWAQQFPEMTDERAFENMVRTNPQRAQQFMNARQQRDAAEHRFHELQQVRAAGEMQIAARAAVSTQQQVGAWATQQDDIFQRELATRHPNYSKGPGLAKLQTAAKEYMLNDMGLSQAEIDRQWKGGALRSAAAQIALADAVAWKLARESVSPQALASHRAPVPPVQRPGVNRPRGADTEADIAALERQIEKAPTAQKQLQLARQLTQARRAAGLL